MKVIKNSILYTVVLVIKNGIGFFLLPIYTSYLTTSDYGIVSVVTSLTQFISILMLLSMNGAGVRFHYDYADDPIGQKKLWGNILTFVLVNSSVIAVFLVAGHALLLDPFFKEVPFYPYLAIGVGICFFQAAFEVYQSYLRAQQDGKRFAANNMAFFFIKVGLTLTFLIVFKMAASGALLALMLAQLFFFVTSLIRFVPLLQLKPQKAILKSTISYALPMLPHLLAGWAMTLIDRILIGNLKSASDVGIFTIGYQIASIIQMLTLAANQAYSPWFYEKCKEGEKGKSKIQEYSEFLVVFSSILGLFVALFAPEVIKLIVTRNFEGGWIVTPFLVFAFVYHGIYYVLVGPLFLKRIRLVPVITIFGAVLNTVLNYFFIQRFGILGSAVANTLTMLLSTILTYILSVRTEYFGYRWKSMLVWSTGCFAVSLIVFLQSEMPFWLMLLIKLVLGSAAALLFYLKYRKRLWPIIETLFRKNQTNNLE